MHNENADLDGKIPFIGKTQKKTIVPVIALAGNPNTGKTTVFNALTGLRQHTGNWPGKTVLKAEGSFIYKGTTYQVIDLPGTYSLMANSVDEEVARDFLCFFQPDATVVVIDATCLERNLNLALQVMEITSQVVVCLNLMDEAYRKGIKVNIDKLEELLQVPVVPTAARSGEGLDKLVKVISQVVSGERKISPRLVRYSPQVEQAITEIEPRIKKLTGNKINSRWLSLRILEGNQEILNRLVNTGQAREAI
ncbi:FeoB small GTPase domain-containing protein [Syntrophomonas erecta]